MKSRKIDNYIRKSIGIPDSETSVDLYLSIIPDVFFLAIQDKVTNLTMTQDQYNCVSRWMVYSGQWNWDKETFMGMKLQIYDR